MAITEISLSTQALDGTLIPSKISTNPSDNFVFPASVAGTIFSINAGEMTLESQSTRAGLYHTSGARFVYRGNNNTWSLSDNVGNGFLQTSPSGTMTIGNSGFTVGCQGPLVMNSESITNATSIAIGSGAADASAVLDVVSTTQGALMPRMTTTEKNAIVTPATGLIVFDTTLGYLQEYNGTIWTSVSPVTSAAGANTQIQFNNSGAFGATPDLTYVTGQLNLLDTTNTGNQYLVMGSDSNHVIAFTNKDNTVAYSDIQFTTSDNSLRLKNYLGGNIEFSGGPEGPFTPTIIFDNSDISSGHIVVKTTNGGGALAQVEFQANSPDASGFFFNKLDSSQIAYVDSTETLLALRHIAGDVDMQAGGQIRLRTSNGGNDFTFHTNGVLNTPSAVMVGDPTNAPNASAILDVTSTTKGLLPPRMSTAQKNAISSPATGLVVFDTDLNQLNYYNGTSWVSLGSVSVTTVTTTYTASTFSIILGNATTGAFTINLPAAATSAGLQYSIKKIDSSANAITIDANGSETIDGALTQSLIAQWQSYTLVCNGTSWFLI